MIQNCLNMWGYKMCNCNEEINKKCPNRVCAYCDWHLELQSKVQKLNKIREISKEYKVEYTVNKCVQLLTNKILQIIEGKENE